MTLSGAWQSDPISTNFGTAIMTARHPLRDMQLVRIDGAARLVATISPCSFMYPRYGLQISVTLNDGQLSILGNHKPMESVTEADVQALFDEVKTHPCVQCQAPAFDRATIPTNTEKLCWECITELVNRENEAERMVLERELAALKADAKAKGYTHLVTAVAHRQHDDEAIYFFTMGTSPHLIESHLRKEGLQLTTNYRVEAL